MQVHQGFHLRGSLLVLLLASAECMRVDKNIQESIARSQIVEDAKEAHETIKKSGWFWSQGHDVCKKDVTNLGYYKHKIEKLRTIGGKVAGGGLNYPMFLQFLGRMKTFATCTDPDVLGSLPESVVGAMYPTNATSPDSLSNVFEDARSNLTKLMHNNNLFLNDGQCGFHPEAVDIIVAAEDPKKPQDALRRQMFGNDCDLGKMNQYIAKQGTLKQKTIALVKSPLMNIVALLSKRTIESKKNLLDQLSGQAAKLDVDLDKILKENLPDEGLSQSLMQVGTDIEGMDSAETMIVDILIFWIPIIVVFLLLVVFFVAMYIAKAMDEKRSHTTSQGDR